MSESAIVADAEILNGIPCFRGTEVPFRNLLDYLQGGHSLDEFLEQFPTVDHDLAVQAIEQAGTHLLASLA